jgi:hypothetical protein
MRPPAIPITQSGPAIYLPLCITGPSAIRHSDLGECDLSKRLWSTPTGHQETQLANEKTSFRAIAGDRHVMLSQIHPSVILSHPLAREGLAVARRHYSRHTYVGVHRSVGPLLLALSFCLHVGSVKTLDHLSDQSEIRQISSQLMDGLKLAEAVREAILESDGMAFSSKSERFAVPSRSLMCANFSSSAQNIPVCVKYESHCVRADDCNNRLISVSVLFARFPIF